MAPKSQHREGILVELKDAPMIKYWLVMCFLLVASSSISCTTSSLAVKVERYQGDLVLEERAQYARIASVSRAAFGSLIIAWNDAETYVKVLSKKSKIQSANSSGHTESVREIQGAAQELKATIEKWSDDSSYSMKVTNSFHVVRTLASAIDQLLAVQNLLDSGDSVTSKLQVALKSAVKEIQSVEQALRGDGKDRKFNELLSKLRALNDAIDSKETELDSKKSEVSASIIAALESQIPQDLDLARDKLSSAMEDYKKKYERLHGAAELLDAVNDLHSKVESLFGVSSRKIAQAKQLQYRIHDVMHWAASKRAVGSFAPFENSDEFTAALDVLWSVVRSAVSSVSGTEITIDDAVKSLTLSRLSEDDSEDKKEGKNRVTATREGAEALISLIGADKGNDVKLTVADINSLYTLLADHSLVFNPIESKSRQKRAEQALLVARYSERLESLQRSIELHDANVAGLIARMKKRQHDLRTRWEERDDPRKHSIDGYRKSESEIIRQYWDYGPLVREYHEYGEMTGLKPDEEYLELMSRLWLQLSLLYPRISGLASFLLRDPHGRPDAETESMEDRLRSSRDAQWSDLLNAQKQVTSYFEQIVKQDLKTASAKKIVELEEALEREEERYATAKDLFDAAVTAKKSYDDAVKALKSGSTTALKSDEAVLVRLKQDYERVYSLAELELDRLEAELAIADNELQSKKASNNPNAAPQRKLEHAKESLALLNQKTALQERIKGANQRLTDIKKCATKEIKGLWAQPPAKNINHGSANTALVNAKDRVDEAVKLISTWHDKRKRAVAKAQAALTTAKDAALTSRQQMQARYNQLKFLRQIESDYSAVRSAGAYLALEEAEAAAGPGQSPWKEITTVKVEAGAKAEYVIMRDRLGNWQVKAASNDPTEMINAGFGATLAAIELALASSSGGSTEVKELIEKRVDDMKKGGPAHSYAITKLVESLLNDVQKVADNKKTAAESAKSDYEDDKPKYQAYEDALKAQIKALDEQDKLIVALQSAFNSVDAKQSKE